VRPYDLDARRGTRKAMDPCMVARLKNRSVDSGGGCEDTYKQEMRVGWPWRGSSMDDIQGKYW
jgi:hypothetical protein